MPSVLTNLINLTTFTIMDDIMEDIQSVKNLADQLYKNIIFDDDLLDIFNEKYNIERTDYTNYKLLLNIGHFYVIKKDDIRTATFYYDKVTKLNNSLGLYSLAVYYFGKNIMSRAKLYATNGISLNGYCLKCTLLLTKIYVGDKKYDNAEESFLECYNFQKLNKRIGNDERLWLLENLCMHYLNNAKTNLKLLEYCNELTNLGSTHGIVILCKHYLDLHDFDNLGKYAQILISNNLAIGNYYMGMLNYKKMLLACAQISNSDKLNVMSNDDKLELIEMSQMFFESVIENDADILREQSCKTIEILEMFRTKLTNF